MRHLALICSFVLLVGAVLPAQESAPTSPQVDQLKALEADEISQKTIDDLVASVPPAVLVPALEAVASRPTLQKSDVIVRAIGQADPDGTVAITASIRLLSHPQWRAREMAAINLCKYGAKSAPAIPALMRAFKTSRPDPPEDGNASDSRSTEREAYHRWWFLGTLGSIGQPASMVVPELVEDMRVEPTWIRTNIVWLFAFIDPEGTVAVDPLIDLLADGEPGVRAMAVRVLGMVGRPAARAVPALARTLKGCDAQARRSVAEAIRAIGVGADDQARATLVEHLADPDAEVVAAMVDALAAVRGVLPHDVAKLVEGLRRRPVSLTTIAAAYQLSESGRAAATAVPDLIAALGSGSPNLQSLAARALGAIGPAAAPAVPALIELLECRLVPRGDDVIRAAPETEDERAEAWRESVCEAIVEALGHVGPAAKKAIPMIRRIGPFATLIDDERWPMYHRAIERIEPPARMSLPIALDPALVPGPPTESRPAVSTTTEIEPDGSFRVSLHDERGPHLLVFGGSWIELFLSRDAHGRPVAHADLWQFTDCGPPFSSKLEVTEGSLTLRSADWGSGKPIEGVVRLGMRVRAFSFNDPFAAR